MTVSSWGLILGKLGNPMYPVAHPNVAIGDPPFSSMILLLKPALRAGIFQLV
jgi:hypothetical protein